MQFACATLTLSFIVISFSACISAQQEQYPQDAMDHTWIPLKATQDELKGIRNTLREVIDHHLDKQLSKKQKTVTDDKANTYGWSINGLLAWLGFLTKPKEIEQDMSTVYFDVYNRLSKAIKKNKNFEYTLAEAGEVGQAVEQLVDWYDENKDLIQKIKNNTVEVKNNALMSKPTCSEEALCLYNHKVDDVPMPHEISDSIVRFIYRINNPSKIYSIAGSGGEYLLHSQDSFDGLEPEITTGAQISLLPPKIRENDEGFPTTQLWVNELCAIRLSNDYTALDIFCRASKVVSLLAAEYSLNYLVGLYATKKKLERKEDEDGMERFARKLYGNKESSGEVKLMVFKLPKGKRRYQKRYNQRSSYADSVRVQDRRYAEAACVFGTEGFTKAQLQFVGMDKINAQCLYCLDSKLYQTPLQGFKPREVSVPCEVTFKKMVSPTRFISLFLTNTGDVWARLYKPTMHSHGMDGRRIYNYEWFNLDLQGQEVENIAAEWWPELGKIGFALITKEGQLLCEQGPDTVDACIQWMKSIAPESFYKLQPGEKGSRLYVHNKKAILLYGKEGYRQQFLEVPIAWS